MKSSEILRKAAQRVEQSAWMVGCYAIYISSTGKEEQSRAMDFFDFVRPAGFSDQQPWWGDADTVDQPEHNDARIIGLCLAAAIAESEGQ